MQGSSGKKGFSGAIVLVAGVVAIVVGVLGLQMTQRRGTDALRPVQLPEFISAAPQVSRGAAADGAATVRDEVVPVAAGAAEHAVAAGRAVEPESAGVSTDGTDADSAGAQRVVEAGVANGVAPQPGQSVLQEQQDQQEQQGQSGELAQQGSGERVGVIPPVNTDYAGVRIVGGVVQFYFFAQQSVLCDGAKAALADAVLAAKRGRFLVVNGYRLAGGADVQADEALAKQRGMAIRTVLIAMGAPAERVVLLKPQPVEEAQLEDGQLRRLDVRIERDVSYGADEVFAVEAPADAGTGNRQ